MNSERPGNADPTRRENTPAESPGTGPSGPAAQPPAAHEEMLPSDFGVQTPLITYVILGLTVLVYLAQIASEAIYGFDVPAGLGMKVNDLVAQGQFWRLLTPLLLHGSILHIGFNMYALNAIGPGLEKQFGRLRFLLLYLLSGLAGNVFSLTFTAQNSLGASTAIFGLLGAQGVFIYQNRALYGSRSRAILNQIIYLAAINLVFGLQAGIDNWGHIGGLLGGLLYTWLAGPLLSIERTPPRIRVVDRRDPNAWLVAAIVVGVVFGTIVLGVIFLRL